jgi:hypothetical protein
MKNPSDIKSLAWQRLDEAKVLYRNKKYDGAFYLAGYSVELMLKAKICENWGISNLFDLDDKKVGADIAKIREVVKTHKLTILLILSGLKTKFDSDKASNKNLFKANSILFERWSEQVRYFPAGFIKNNEVKHLIDLLKDKKGLLKWIEQN